MTGAENLLRTLAAAGVEVCFANPGTSEMHLVTAIGKTEAMRPVLCLFEGVASGAADGYARMRDKPALTLLHVGSGFANSMANQHNAKRAHVPLVNMVGDHATYHLRYDAPLTSDVPGHARLVSEFVRVSESADDLPRAGADAVRASLDGAGRVATFIAPANHAWEIAGEAVAPLEPAGLQAVEDETIDAAVRVLRNGRRSLLLLGGRALREDALLAAGRIAARTGARLLCEVFPTRLQRGSGRIPLERLPYFAEAAIQTLADVEQLVLVGASAPVAFFAYPGKPSWLAPETCELLTLATVHQNAAGALTAVADRLGATSEPPLTERAPRLPVPTGELTPVAIGQSLTRLLPDDAIVVDESNTCTFEIFPSTARAARHDWLTVTGGAIGDGLPLALGAAVACAERKVVALQADGSAMYTLQALWTMARERSDVVVVIMNNRRYAVLNIELGRLGAGPPTAKTLSMFDLSQPDLDFVALAQGLGVPATRASSADEFDARLAEALSQPGPRLIEAMVVQRMPG